MDQTFEEKYHQIEDTYWWFRARRDFVVRLVTRRLRIPPAAAILEVGCSGGPLLQQFAARGYSNLHGIDLSPSAIDLCHRRGLAQVAVMDAASPDFPDSSFDLILASDILEHIDNAPAALAQWRRILKPAGQLLVFVPAFNFLWSEHDTVNRHFRRYTKPQILRDLAAAGLTIRQSSYWNAGLFAPVAAVRLGKRLVRRHDRPPQDHLPAVPRPVDAALFNLLRLENTWLLTGLPLPAGVSVFALAQRPGA